MTTFARIHHSQAEMLAQQLATVGQFGKYFAFIWCHFVVPFFMKQKHRRTLALIFKRPVSGNIKWNDIQSLFLALSAEISEREGSRVAVVLFDEVKIFHRPHPSPNTDKGAVASIRKWLESNGVTP